MRDRVILIVDDAVEAALAIDDVGAAALNGDLAGFGRGELRDVELEPGFPVETEGAHDRHLPAGGAGLLQREPQFFCMRRSGCKQGGGE